MEVGDQPLHWIERALVIYSAKKEAAIEIANKGAFPVYEVKF
jgi:hypothetical protein